LGKLALEKFGAVCHKVDPVVTLLGSAKKFQRPIGK